MDMTKATTADGKELKIALNVPVYCVTDDDEMHIGNLTYVNQRGVSLPQPVGIFWKSVHNHRYEEGKHITRYKPHVVSIDNVYFERANAFKVIARRNKDKG